MGNYFTRYGCIGFIRLILDITLTRLLFSRARIIRRPFYIRGRRHIYIGEGFTTGVNLRIDAIPKNNERKVILSIGDNVEINDYVHIGAIDSVTIGNNVLLASKVFITDHNHGNYSGTNGHDNPNTPPRLREWHSSPVVIEDNVWIGEQVSILPGVTIGKGSVIGALSMVNKSIPPYSIAVGIPAKVIKQYNFQTELWEKI